MEEEYVGDFNVDIASVDGIGGDDVDVNEDPPNWLLSTCTRPNALLSLKSIVQQKNTPCNTLPLATK